MDLPQNLENCLKTIWLKIYFKTTIQLYLEYRMLREDEHKFSPVTFNIILKSAL
jgi:hypothetical protein